MKKIVLSLIVLLVGCKSDDDNLETDFLIGKWKIIEQLSDPGDGSGTFQPVNSDRVIEFFNNKKVSVNGNLCSMVTEVGNINTGVYELLENVDSNFDGKIIPNDCNANNVKVYFSLQQSGNLILWYQCIEPCAQKFVKVQ